MHAVGLALSMLAGNVPERVKQHEELAVDVRNSIFDYQYINWEKQSMFANMPWHTVITMAHNIAITQSERMEFGDWGNSPASQKQCWEREMAGLYGTTSEFLAVCEMAKLKNVDIVFRIWRKHGRPVELIPMETIPSNATHGFVFDVLHTGANDTSIAHYQLLNSGYALLLDKPCIKNEPAKKRKRCLVKK